MAEQEFKPKKSNSTAGALGPLLHCTGSFKSNGLQNTTSIYMKYPEKVNKVDRWLPKARVGGWEDEKWSMEFLFG